MTSLYQQALDIQVCMIKSPDRENAPPPAPGYIYFEVNRCAKS